MRQIIEVISADYKQVDLQKYFKKILIKIENYPQDELIWLMVTAWNLSVNDYTVNKALSSWCDISFSLLRHVKNKENYEPQMQEAYKEMMQ